MNFFESTTFFVLSKIALIAIVVLVFVLIIYAISILRDVKSVTKEVKGGAKKASKDALPLIKSVTRILGTIFLVSVVKRIKRRNQK